jgi:hypothetical protein
MKVYLLNGFWVLDATMTRTDAYQVGEYIPYGTQVCLDKNDMKVRKVCAIAPAAPVTTPEPVAEAIVYHTVEVALAPGRRAVERNGYWFSTAVATEGYEVAETLAVGTKACLDKNDMKIRTACAIAPVAPVTTTQPVAEVIVYHTVEVPLTPPMKAYEMNGFWYADVTMTRTDAYEVSETLKVGSKACLDKNDMKIRTACAIAPVAPVNTTAPVADAIVYFPVMAALIPTMKVYQENGFWMIDATMTRTDSY